MIATFNEIEDLLVVGLTAYPVSINKNLNILEPLKGFVLMSFLVLINFAEFSIKSLYFSLQLATFDQTFVKISLAVEAIRRSKEIGSETIPSLQRLPSFNLPFQLYIVLISMWWFAPRTSNTRFSSRMMPKTRIFKNKHYSTSFHEKLGLFAKMGSLFLKISNRTFRASFLV